ncbi:MAG TPA: ferritin-like domain-containing protein [Candidatus Sulfotelmatobacter sp.]|nr:ferritin-like domain-containing protein [Candidatus Sulfotelmatobacter sp.]
MKTLKHLFIAELQDMYDAEHRILKALPKLAKAATCEKLKAALLKHLGETEQQVAKLEQIFPLFNEKPKAKKCKATVGLLEEGDEIASENKGQPTINAALISAGQKVEHYEIASYGCLHAWAEKLGNHEAAGLINEILDQEKAANETLTKLAKDSANDQALGETDEKESADVDPKTGLKNLPLGGRAAGIGHKPVSNR